MELIYVLIGGLIIFGIKAIYDEKNNKKIFEYQIEDEWGKLSKEEFATDKFNSIETYFRSHYNKETDIDEITWYDLDMDEIYLMMNTTNCGIGEEYLYHLLHRLEFDEKELQKRNELIEYFRKKKSVRKQLQMLLRSLGKFNNISIYEFFNRTEDIQVKNPEKHYICFLGLIASIVMLFVEVQMGILMLIGFFVYNVVTYFKAKGDIEKYLSIFSYILRITDMASKMQSIDSPELKPYMDTIKVEAKTLNNMKRGSNFVLSGRSMAGSLGDMLMDYVRMLTHVDIIKFNHMLKEVRKNREHLMKIYETIGLLDSMIAVASFRTYLKEEYCIPVLKKQETPYLDVTNVYHPLIKNPVKNSIHEKQSALLTGSNASGKSTFLKTLAINSLLAQTIYTSLSEHYEASYFKIYSSMALQDNIFNNESYYIVEIKSLKRILDQVNPHVPTLCFVDEVLRGTNTLERIAASAEILYSLAKHNVLCLAATHDIELTHILENKYSNYHFQEEVVENDILFDYKLYKGRSVSKNAIKLLKIIGYNDTLIKAATNRANSFLSTGTWDVFEN